MSQRSLWSWLKKKLREKVKLVISLALHVITGVMIVTIVGFGNSCKVRHQEPDLTQKDNYQFVETIKREAARVTEKVKSRRHAHHCNK